MQTINTKGKAIAEDLKLVKMIELYSQKQSFIMLKDHKENFKCNPKRILTVPAEGGIGAVSK